MDSDAGPNDAPPSLPVGWIAQWDGSSRKYYYVQISTGESVWDIPTREAPLVPTPGTTPAQTQNPYPKPAEAGTEGGDRGLGSMAMNALLNSSSNKPQSQQSGLGALANQLLNHNGQSHGGSGILGTLAEGLLGGHKTQSSTHQSNHHSGGLMSSFGVGGSANQGFGYSSSGSSGTYTGQAPPSSYQPGKQSYGPGQSTHQSAQPPAASQSHPPHDSQMSSPGFAASPSGLGPPPPPYQPVYPQGTGGEHYDQTQQQQGYAPQGYAAQYPGGYAQGQYQPYPAGAPLPPGDQHTAQHHASLQHDHDDHGGRPPYPDSGPGHGQW